MKFRKSSLSSPRMELLSRRSTDGKISTLKRSRSFRASMKLMSKIRNQANLRLATTFDFSPTFSKHLSTKNTDTNLQIIEESQNVTNKPLFVTLNSQIDCDDTNSTNKDEINDEASCPSLRKLSVSGHNVNLCEITKDLKNKLSLTDRIMGKGLKDMERSPMTKNESAKSPKVIGIFRRKHTMESLQENTRGKDHKKHVSCKTDMCQWSKRVSYENPTFLDSSLDSSISSFLFEPEGQEQRQDCKDKCAVSSERDILTIIVDSQKDRINQSCCYKVNQEQDKNEDEKYLKNKKLQDMFCSSYEMNPSRYPCKEWNGYLQMDMTNENQKESFNKFDRSNIKLFYKMDEIKGKKSAANCLQNQMPPDNIKKSISVCPSKSCGIRKVDNITNLWSSSRGSSFRSKMVTGRKRNTKEVKDYERFDQERVLVSTSSGSSTLDQ